MAQELLDLEELVRHWVGEFPLDKKQRQEADEIKSTDINWNHMRIHHGPTEYFDQAKPSTPTKHVLFSAHFANDTDQQQVYTLKTERRTKSTCSISMEKAYMIGFNLDIKLGPPNPIIEANAGFKGEMTVAKADNETFEEELVWSVDNQISVPAKVRTKADLVLKEDEYTSHFKCETRFEGKIHVTLRSKKDNSEIVTLTGDVRNIFRADQGFRVDKHGIYFTSEGNCKCRFGIEQHVSLTQADITGDEKNVNDE